MKTFSGLLALALCFSGFHARAEAGHLELEMTSAQYQKLLAQRNGQTRDDKIKPSLKMGKRFLEWLTFVNENRPEGKKISLTSPETTIAFPVSKPNRSNPELISGRYEELKTTIPAWMREIVFEGKDFIKDLPEADAVFIKHGFNLDRNYQSAARWSLQEGSLWAYAMRRSDDVRGYYNLNQIADIQAKWQGWDQLATPEKAELLNSMAQLCRISLSDSRCKSLVDEAKNEGSKLSGLYGEWMPAGKKKWDSFFKMSNLRSDVLWNAPQLMELPFRDLSSEAEKSFLVNNVQDEWKWKGWNLRLAFAADAAPNMVFEAGATPHVNGLGGNTITMDSNTPLTEYGVQWTIRHEFGHVLGFPDCYIEFYDTDERVMINYQLDITNLMCSRRGKLQDIHFEALKEAYYIH